MESTSKKRFWEIVWKIKKNTKSEKEFKKNKKTRENQKNKKQKNKKKQKKQKNQGIWEKWPPKPFPETLGFFVFFVFLDVFLFFFSRLFWLWGFYRKFRRFFLTVFFLKRHIGAVHSFPSNTCHIQSKSKKKKLEKTKKQEKKTIWETGGLTALLSVFFCEKAQILHTGKIQVLYIYILYIYILNQTRKLGDRRRSDTVDPSLNHKPCQLRAWVVPIPSSGGRFFRWDPGSLKNVKKLVVTLTWRIIPLSK